MKVIRVKTPKSRDPFINARLVPLGCDSKGRERFWISSCNGQGSVGIMIDEDGNHRLYRLNKPPIQYCYSAAPENDNVLWLCVNLTHMARLDLTTGAYKMYETGAAPAFVCCGGRLDQASGKFFTAGCLNNAENETMAAISFDVKTRQTVVYRNAAPEQYMYTCGRTPDGSYLGLIVGTGASILRWDPRAETLDSVRVLDKGSVEGSHPLWIIDDQGRPYIPHHGWFDYKKRSFAVDGPKPEREMMWFERLGNQAIGCEEDPAIGLIIYSWDMSTGKVRRVTSIPSCHAQGVLVTRSGKLVSVNTYGEFRLHNIETGRLELFRRPPTDVNAPGFRLLRYDKQRLLGAGFITQRFWEVNLKTGRGFDCGQAAPGGGQIEHFWKIGGKVYLASYASGCLTEYNPRTLPRFPENPHVVAEPPCSMRPTSYADDGRNIYYACNQHYGHLGATVTKYDTRTGRYIFHTDPVKEQSIISIWLDRRSQKLLGHTAFRADANSCPATVDFTYHFRLNAADLSLIDAVPMPAAIHSSGIIGPLDRDHLLCKYDAEVGGRPRQPYLAVIDREGFTPPGKNQLLEPPPGMWTSQADIWRAKICHAGRPGLFVLYRDKGIELWDMRTWKCLKLLKKIRHVQELTVQDRSVYVCFDNDVMILEDVL